MKFKSNKQRKAVMAKLRLYKQISPNDWEYTYMIKTDHGRTVGILKSPRPDNPNRHLVVVTENDTGRYDYKVNPITNRGFINRNNAKMYALGFMRREEELLLDKRKYKYKKGELLG